jgi:hypothetical protein
MKDTLDARVLAKALVFTISTIDALPADLRRQQAPDRDDMVHMLHMMVPNAADRALLAEGVEAITGRRVDLTDRQLDPYL